MQLTCCKAHIDWPQRAVPLVGACRYRKLSIEKLIIIRTARMPIIKLTTSDNVTVDISIGDDSGPRAARYCAQQLQVRALTSRLLRSLAARRACAVGCRCPAPLPPCVQAYRPLRPLVLVLKTYLRSCGLNDVATGGLSSFALTNMVLAHLMEELRVGCRAPRHSSCVLPCCWLLLLARPAAVSWPRAAGARQQQPLDGRPCSPVLQSGNDIYDLGECLYSFLLRYGDEFDYGEPQQGSPPAPSSDTATPSSRLLLLHSSAGCTAGQ
jgi:DNA polymerase sigma